jgi:hypothetical protein
MNLDHGLDLGDHRVLDEEVYSIALLERDALV